MYVNDVILDANYLNEFTRIKGILDNKFKVKDLGILKYLLGLEVAHSHLGTYISQRNYCLYLLESNESKFIINQHPS